MTQALSISLELHLLMMLELSFMIVICLRYRSQLSCAPHRPVACLNTPLMIVNDDSRVINKLETSLTDAARVVIYDHQMFIVQATGSSPYIRLALKGFSAANNPAYLTPSSVTKKKVFNVELWS